MIDWIYMNWIQFRIPVGEAFRWLVDWLRNNLEWLFDGISEVVGALIFYLEAGLGGMADVLLILILVLIAWKIAGWGIALFAALSFVLIGAMDLWVETVKTLSLVLTATFFALVIGIPVGIWAARNNRVDNFVRPILDFMQTMPAFVYLIPAVMFFHVGRVPAAIATILFAMPPAVRLTNLGIRQVPKDVIEAAKAYGSTPNQMLMKVQLPMALPTIMAGVNQCIMLSLSMVVISSMVGGPGLGEVVLRGVTQFKIGLGFEGGVAVVLLAMYLDRVTEALGKIKKR